MQSLWSVEFEAMQDMKIHLPTNRALCPLLRKVAQKVGDLMIIQELRCLFHGNVAGIVWTSFVH